MRSAYIKNKEIKRRYKEALSYLGYCIKEGYLAAEDCEFDQMTEAQIILMAERMMNKGDAYYNEKTK